MTDTKTVKAYCKKTKQYFALEVKQFAGKWKVVNMIRLSDDEAKFVSSEVELTSLETHNTLIACEKCGNRKIGGCSCAKRRGTCAKGSPYRFDCIYCDECVIDNSVPSSSEARGRAGETVRLSQGQEVKIRYADDRPSDKIIVGVGWDPADAGENSMDVDSSVFLKRAGTSAMDTNDFVYFGHKEHESGAVIHHGDNLTGKDDTSTQGADDENITVYLKKVPQNRDRLVFVLNIYKSHERNQTLDKVKNLYIKIYDPTTKKVLIEYRIDGNAPRDTAMIIGMAYRDGGEWSFKAIGRSLRVANLTELAQKCDAYL